MNSVYPINKGINQCILFKGLKAQYIWYLGAGVVGIMILFAVLYIIGLPSIICVALIGSSGGFLVFQIYRLSNRYGQYGMMKALARKQIPKVIKLHSRGVFIM
jgi:hypothetical protein